ncbi:hypothetical protein X744_32195 [Mesorhizobium sp. LNJC372A00]|nr:hypothetical protein X744_32195 [Mesorhizobium sp. LNJC372A00]
MNAQPLAADPRARIAKVDLHLMTWRRLKANRRALLRLQFPPPALHSQLHRAKPDHDTMFARQFLANDIRVSIMTKETLSKPIVQTVECSSTSRLAIRHDTTFTQIAANRIARATELLRNALRTPADLMQPNHR